MTVFTSASLSSVCGPGQPGHSDGTILRVGTLRQSGGQGRPVRVLRLGVGFVGLGSRRDVAPAWKMSPTVVQLANAGVCDAICPASVADRLLHNSTRPLCHRKFSAQAFTTVHRCAAASRRSVCQHTFGGAEPMLTSMPLGLHQHGPSPLSLLLMATILPCSWPQCIHLDLRYLSAMSD